MPQSLQIVPLSSSAQQDPAAGVACAADKNPATAHRSAVATGGNADDVWVLRTIGVLGRAEVAKTRMRLGRRMLRKGGYQSRFANSWLT